MRLLVPLLLLCAACSSSTAPTPPPPALPACQTSHTADLTVRNTSPNDYTFTLTIDGQTKGSMPVNQSLGPFTLPSGDHLVETFIPNQTQAACSATVTLVDCTNRVLTCSY